jgi:uncharacterized lipoprotein YddW (UPF0748 family)
LGWTRVFILFFFIFVLARSLLGAAGGEFRGVWVHTWSPGMLSPSEIDDTVKWAKDCNLNALIVQARRVGDAYYNSAYEPRASNISADPEFDPLDYALKKGKASGLEVHAWVNVFRVWTSPKQSPPPAHVASQHPEWLSKDINGVYVSKDGRFLDPGVPEVRAYLVKIINDIITKYDIDGIVLDFIRYPGKTWGYNSIAVSRFNARYGRTGIPSPDDPLWCGWRREQVTETVRAIRKEIDRVKPHIKLSAATVAWGPCPSDFTKTDAYGHVFQDWRLWMEEGLLDANMPMNYKDPADAKSSSYFVSWLEGLKKWSYGRHVYCGLMVFNNNVLGAVSQAKLVRDKGLDGVVGFAFCQLPCKDVVASQLKARMFAEAVSTPPMAWKVRTARK